MKKTLLLLCILGMFLSAHTQTVRCFFDSLMLKDTNTFKTHYQTQKSIRAAFPSDVKLGKRYSNKRSTVKQGRYIIPIVVHVVYSTADSSTNISDGQIQNQIDSLNEAMKDSANGIQFCFATKKPDGSGFIGIMRYNTGTTIKATTSTGGFL